ncbi:MAG: hypothetical protein IJ706_03050 [Clostridia bacterium]|nr:hypothetical protein [Clostridia bacterium]
MKVKVIEENREKMGEWGHMDLLKGKVYVAEVERLPTKKELFMYRIVDESGEDYLYPPMLFEIVEE